MLLLQMFYGQLNLMNHFSHLINLIMKNNHYVKKQLPRRYSFQASYERKIMNFIISPYLIYQQQQNFSMLIGGVNALLFKHLNIGL